jgi:MscS family membrane protein
MMTFIGVTGLFDGVRQQIIASAGFSQPVADAIVAALIVAVSIALARVVKYLVSRIAPRLVSKTETTLDDEVLNAVNGPLQWLTIAAGIYLALQVVSPYLGFGEYVDEMLVVVLIFILAYLASNLVKGLLNWYKNDLAKRTQTDVDDMLVPFLQKIIGAAIVVIAIIMALDQLNIVEVTPLITGLGVLGVAVALAAQQFLSDFFGAISIMADRPYKVGDRVRIEGIDAGDVVEIGLRSTRLRTTDNRIIIVPNAKVSKSKVINMSMRDGKISYTIRVGIAYDADVEKATRIIEEVALSTEGVLREPRPKAYVKELGDFAVKIVMFPDVSDYRLDWVVPDRIYRGIVRRFREEGIAFPTPTTNILIKRNGAVAPIPVPAQPPQIKKE